MQINEYQSLAMRTANQSLAQESQLINAALGLCGEAGEFADLIKKVNYQGHDKDKTHLVKELGDICWYIALAATALNVDLELVMTTNIEKLKARYPDGFKASLSMVREAGDV